MSGWSTLKISLFMTALNTVFWTAFNFGVAFLVRCLPKRLFSFDRAFYREHRFEKHLYRFLRVNRWKGHLPEAGGLAGFSKRSLANTLTLQYVERFLMETCIAEVGHLAIGILGYCSVGFAWLLPDPYPYIPLFVVLATLDLFVQLLFVIIQRYNRPRLVRLRDRLLHQAACM